MIALHKPQTLAGILQYKIEEIEAIIEQIKNEPRKSYYSYIQKSVKNGKLKERPIDPSRAKLRDLQNRIHQRILKKLPLPEHMMGSIKGRSNVDNAVTHRGGLHNFQTDLKNFFGYATNKMVFDMLRTHNFSPDVAHLITQLTTFKGHLPQGAPTSPILANLVGISFDTPILSICQHHAIKYTRYVDDLWFSADYDFTHLQGELLKAIKDCKFLYSHRKTLAKAGKIEGTGVKVHKGGRLGLTDAQSKKLSDPGRSENSKKGIQSYKNQVESR